MPTSSPPAWRVLIVSRHPVFFEGLGRLLARVSSVPVDLLGRVDSVEAALAALEAERPDLVIVDCDEAAITRETFLAGFVEGERPVRVVLVSLAETGPVVLYDRRTLAASQEEDWLSAILPGAAGRDAFRPAPSGGEPV